MPLLKELNRSSRDSFGLDSDSKESWDDLLKSFKSGVLYFFDSFDSIFISIRSILRPGVVVDRPGNSFALIAQVLDIPMKCSPWFTKLQRWGQGQVGLALPALA